MQGPLSAHSLKSGYLAAHCASVISPGVVGSGLEDGEGDELGLGSGCGLQAVQTLSQQDVILEAEAQPYGHVRPFGQDIPAQGFVHPSYAFPLYPELQ